MDLATGPDTAGGSTEVARRSSAIGDSDALACFESPSSSTALQYLESSVYSASEKATLLSQLGRPENLSRQSSFGIVADEGTPILEGDTNKVSPGALLGLHSYPSALNLLGDCNFGATLLASPFGGHNAIINDGEIASLVNEIENGLIAKNGDCQAQGHNVTGDCSTNVHNGGNVGELLYNNLDKAIRRLSAVGADGQKHDDVQAANKNTALRQLSLALLQNVNSNHSEGAEGGSVSMPTPAFSALGQLPQQTRDTYFDGKFLVTPEGSHMVGTSNNSSVGSFPSPSQSRKLSSSLKDTIRSTSGVELEMYNHKAGTQFNLSTGATASSTSDPSGNRKRRMSPVSHLSRMTQRVSPCDALGHTISNGVQSKRTSLDLLADSVFVMEPQQQHFNTPRQAGHASAGGAEKHLADEVGLEMEYTNDLISASLPSKYCANSSRLFGSAGTASAAAYDTLPGHAATSMMTAGYMRPEEVKSFRKFCLQQHLMQHHVAHLQHHQRQCHFPVLATASFSNSMVESRRTQTMIEEWDRKMGFFRSHSQTTRNTTRTRKILQEMMRDALLL